jgi:hypothetical protein
MSVSNFYKAMQLGFTLAASYEIIFGTVNMAIYLTLWIIIIELYYMENNKR